MHSTPAILLLLSLLLCAGAQPAALEGRLPGNSFLRPRRARRRLERLQQQVEASGGCNPNVCFAVDGGQFVPSADFTSQLEFVQLVAAIVGADVRSAFAAVQYSRPLRPISFVTQDTDQFLLDMEATVQQGGFRSGIGGGIRFCVRELRRFREDVNKIVVLADGRSFFPRDGQRIAERFRRRRAGNAICAVGVGFEGDTSFLSAITGSENRVLTIDGYFDLLDIIDQLVAEICGIDGLQSGEETDGVVVA